MSIIIRTVTPDDASALSKIYAPYVENTAVTFEITPPSAEDFVQRIANTTIKYPYLVAEEDGVALGYTYAGPFKPREAYNWAVESSIYLSPLATRKGIGTRLYNALEACLKMQGILNLNACVAYIAQEDLHLTDRSRLFHEARGFSPVGFFHQCGYKFNTWYDILWMEKSLGEHLPRQKPVTPFSELDPEAVAALLADC